MTCHGSPDARRPRRRALPLTLACLLVAAAIAAGATSAGGATRVRARACSAPTYPGTGYFTSLRVDGVSCATGRRLVLAYYRCRSRSGPAGRCTRRVLGFRCREKRNSIPTEIDARVTCRRAGRTVVHTYQQDV